MRNIALQEYRKKFLLNAATVAWVILMYAALPWWGPHPRPDDPVTQAFYVVPWLAVTAGVPWLVRRTLREGLKQGAKTAARDAADAGWIALALAVLLVIGLYAPAVAGFILLVYLMGREYN